MTKRGASFIYPVHLEAAFGAHTSRLGVTTRVLLV